MMKLHFIVCVVFTSLVSFGCKCAAEYPEAKITLKVVDESGNTVTGANASVTFEIPKGTEQGSKNVQVKGSTDISGNFSASGSTITSVAYGVSKEGFYKSTGEYNFEKRNSGRWEPWNPEVKVVLRKIEKPVPMYAREFRLELPISDKPVGFDLIEYDWVAPYGKGQHSDLLFKISGTYVNEYEFDNKFEISFPNKFDGIQLVKENRKHGSMLKLPKLAPETGYNNKLVRFRSRVPDKPLREDADDSNNYIFRIRSEENDKKLVRAMYGKIHGDIEFGVKKSKKTIIIFKYYLNPDYSNNLEFDIKQNLFKNLPNTERVGLY